MIRSHTVVRVVHLILKMRERRESSRSQPIELILQEHNLFFLLLNNIQQFALISDVLDLLLRVVFATLVIVGFETRDLVALLDLTLEVSGFLFELFVFLSAVFDCHAEFGDLTVDSGDALLAVDFELGCLFFDVLFVFFFFFDVFALDYFLGLFGYTVELDIFSSFFEV